MLNDSPFILNIAIAFTLCLCIAFIDWKKRHVVKFPHKMKFLGKWYFKQSKAVNVSYKGTENDKRMVFLYADAKRLIYLKAPVEFKCVYSPNQDVSLKQYNILGKGVFFYLDEPVGCEISSLQEESLMLNTMSQLNHFCIYAKAACILLAFILSPSVNSLMIYIGIILAIALISWLNIPFATDAMPNLCEIKVIEDIISDDLQDNFDFPEGYSDFSETEKKLYLFAQKYKKRAESTIAIEEAATDQEPVLESISPLVIEEPEEPVFVAEKNSFEEEADSVFNESPNNSKDSMSDSWFSDNDSEPSETTKENIAKDIDDSVSPLSKPLKEKNIHKEDLQIPFISDSSTPCKQPVRKKETSVKSNASMFD